MEHGVRSDGYNILNSFANNEISQETFFNPVKDVLVPRCLSLDFEPTVLGNIFKISIEFQIKYF